MILGINLLFYKLWEIVVKVKFDMVKCMLNMYYYILFDICVVEFMISGLMYEDIFFFFEEYFKWFGMFLVMVY